MLHRRRRIDFYQPWIAIIINHKVIAEQFEWTLLKLKVLNAFKTPLNNVLHFLFKTSLFPNIWIIGLLKVLGKGLRSPHISFSYFNSILCIFSDRIIGEMHVSIKILWVIFSSWKTNIRFVPKPNGQRIPRSDNDPYTNIKLPSLN